VELLHRILHGLYSINRYYATFSECLMNSRTVPYFRDASRLEDLIARHMNVKVSTINPLYVQENETAYVARQMPIASRSRIICTSVLSLWSLRFYARRIPARFPVGTDTFHTHQAWQRCHYFLCDICWFYSTRWLYR
jgi:hypothetical protein